MIHNLLYSVLVHLLVPRHLANFFLRNLGFDRTLYPLSLSVHLVNSPHFFLGQREEQE